MNQMEKRYKVDEYPMLSKRKKGCVALNFNIDRLLVDALDGYCKEAGMKKTDAVEMFIFNGLYDLSNKDKLPESLEQYCFESRNGSYFKSKRDRELEPVKKKK